MNDTKKKLAEDGDLPIERVWRVGDYFKSLFARSLKLGLDYGPRECAWDEAPVPVDRCSAATDPAGGREPEDKSEEERNGSRARGRHGTASRRPEEGESAGEGCSPSGDNRE